MCQTSCAYSLLMNQQARNSCCPGIASLPGPTMTVHVHMCIHMYTCVHACSLVPRLPSTCVHCTMLCSHHFPVTYNDRVFQSWWWVVMSVPIPLPGTVLSPALSIPTALTPPTVSALSETQTEIMCSHSHPSPLKK